MQLKFQFANKNNKTPLYVVRKLVKTIIILF